MAKAELESFDEDKLKCSNCKKYFDLKQMCEHVLNWNPQPNSTTPNRHFYCEKCICPDATNVFRVKYK